MVGAKDLLANFRVSVIGSGGEMPKAKYLIHRKWSLVSKAVLVTSFKSVRFQAYYSPYSQALQIVLNYEKSKLRLLSLEVFTCYFSTFF